MEKKMGIFILRETSNGVTTPLGWSTTKDEVKTKMNERVGALTRELELDGSKVFTNRSSEDRTCVYKMRPGFIYGGDMVTQSTLSVTEVQHISSSVKKKEMDKVEIIEKMTIDASILD